MSAKTKWLAIRTAVISQQRGACLEDGCLSQGMDLIATSPQTWGAFCRKHRILRQSSQIQQRRAEKKLASVAQGLLGLDAVVPRDGSASNTRNS